MAITRETKVSMPASKTPSDYVAGAQSYIPSVGAMKRVGLNIEVGASGVAHATNLTGFTQLLTQIDTDFAVGDMLDMAIDATQTVSLLIVVKNVTRVNSLHLTNKEQYQIGVDVFNVVVDIFWEETV